MGTTTQASNLDVVLEKADGTSARADSGTIKPTDAVITRVNLTGTVVNDFSMKTLYQERLKNVTDNLKEVFDFVNSFATPNRFINGKYIEGKIQYIPRGIKFSDEAFVPSALNVGSKDVSIRRDVHNLWIPTKMTMPQAREENIYANRLDYRLDAYVQKLITGQEFINDSFGTLAISTELVSANRAILGHDYIDDIDGTDGKLHAVGLKDLIATALSDSPISIDQINLTNGKGQRYIQYKNLASDTGESTTEALSQFRTLIRYMKQNNNVLCHYPTIIQSAIKPLTIIATIRTIESIEAKDVNFLKSLKDAFGVQVVALPSTTLDAEFEEDASCLSIKYAGLLPLIGPDGVGLQDGQLFIIEKDTIERFENLTVGKLENQFQQNITVSHFINASLGADLTPDKSYAIFEAPILLSQFGLPVVDVSKQITTSNKKFVKENSEVIDELQESAKEKIAVALGGK